MHVDVNADIFRLQIETAAFATPLVRGNAHEHVSGIFHGGIVRIIDFFEALARIYLWEV